MHVPASGRRRGLSQFPAMSHLWPLVPLKCRPSTRIDCVGVVGRLAEGLLHDGALPGGPLLRGHVPSAPHRSTARAHVLVPIPPRRDQHQLSSATWTPPLRPRERISGRRGRRRRDVEATSRSHRRRQAVGPYHVLMRCSLRQHLPPCQGFALIKLQEMFTFQRNIS